MALDLRTVQNLSPLQQAVASFLRTRLFQWTRWHSESLDWTHDHCQLCNACICNHRDDHPYQREEHEARGCYRHAYQSLPANDSTESPIWLCRNCYKRGILVHP